MQKRVLIFLLLAAITWLYSSPLFAQTLFGSTPQGGADEPPKVMEPSVFKEKVRSAAEQHRNNLNQRFGEELKKRKPSLLPDQGGRESNLKSSPPAPQSLSTPAPATPRTQTQQPPAATSPPPYTGFGTPSSTQNTGGTPKRSGSGWNIEY